MPARAAPGGGPRPRRGRLSRSADFERAFRQGASTANRFLVLYAFPRPRAETGGGNGEAVRLGVSVSRKVGGAVERNRVKRVLREAFWSVAGERPRAADYVIVARPDVRALDERGGREGVREALAELLGQLDERSKEESG